MKANALKDFSVGQNVSVTAMTGDDFNDFTGNIVSKGVLFITVKDQEGNCWDCIPAQLSRGGEERSDSFDNAPERPAHCYLVFTMGFYGKSATLKDAAIACYKAGGKKEQRAVARLIIGDAAPEVTDRAEVLRAPGSHSFVVGNGFKLGQLMTLE